MPEPAKKPSFESRLDELNALIKQLEKGDLGLEDAIATFEHGRALHHDLAAQLQDFERRIEVLTRGADGQDRAEAASPNLLRSLGTPEVARKNEQSPPF